MNEHNTAEIEAWGRRDAGYGRRYESQCLRLAGDVASAEDHVSRFGRTETGIYSGSGAAIGWRRFAICSHLVDSV